MKKNIILSAPTAKIQIGNQASITLDTTISNGKKSFKIDIITLNDTISKEIEDVVDDMVSSFKSEMNKVTPESKNQLIESQVEIQRIKHESIVDTIGVFIPIVAIVAILVYFIFRSFQNRKWKEALLNKGVAIEEIEKYSLGQTKDISLKAGDLESYEKRKSMKYAIVFGSFGISILLGTIMDNAGYFFGFLFVLLGLGFWHYTQKTT